MVREVWGARHEPPLYSCARWCFVTRRRGPWAIAMGITKIRIDDADARGRAAAVVCGVSSSRRRRPKWFLFSILTCSSWPRHWPRFAHWKTIGVGWVGKGGGVGLGSGVVWPPAAGVSAGAVPSGGFDGGCCGKLAAWAVAAGTRVVAVGAKRW